MKKILSCKEYTADPSDNYIECNCISDNLTFNLYSHLRNIGNKITIKKVGNKDNFVKIIGTIGNETEYYLSNENEYVTLIATQNGWDILDYNKSIYSSSMDFYYPTIQPASDGVENPHGVNATLSEIYDLYNNLIAENSSYISKTILGKDQSNTHDVWRLDFNPINANYKLILGAGIHWENADHIIALYNFMREICNNWKNDEILKFLRWKVHIIVLPVENPWGLANKTRQNSRGVDLNRNFDYKWSEYTTDDAANPASYFYKGASAFSEKETQYIRDVLLTNRDTLVYNSFHMDTAADKVFRYYIELPDRNIMNYVANNVITYMEEIYPFPGENLINVGYKPYSHTYAKHVLGIFASNPEGNNDTTNPKLGSEHATERLAWYVNVTWAMLKKAIELKHTKDFTWENKITNGNYLSTEDYETANANAILSTSKNTLISTHTGALSGSAVRSTKYLIRNGNRYYVRAKCDISSVTNVTDIRLYARNEAGTFYDITTQSSPSASTKYTLSGIIDAADDLKPGIRVTSSGNVVDGFKLTLYGDNSDGFLVLDLGNSTNKSKLYDVPIADIESYIAKLGGWWRDIPVNVASATNTCLFDGRSQSQYPAVGTYTGDGVGAGQTITLNFAPKKITVYDDAGAVVLNWCTGMSLTDIVKTSTGFTAKGTCNTNEAVYYYEVF